ncbi:hypothetical protein GALMADRAFT_877822 [Galerina marginata CBS 339.88]|uniref:Uncharacterized protein n=1 Tax=Galerina marginata (strain CBS 339.88) TaxID=685588 RepID=A0A067SUV1_GALM3|nr:hypothetical protein GALMADRAFT_877822 [Galerina marginata CBS 339.88]
MAYAPNGTNELSVPSPWQYLGRGPDTPSWHPKITPYRLIVLSTTVILGSAKALLTERGSIIVPITLEWLTGTVLFLLVSAYDSRETIPPSLSWLFDNDCMELVWSLREFLSGRSRPRYFSDEKPAIVDGYTDQPPITAYRILVCSAVISFGVSKAVLSYSDLSAAVAWTDWALAVPVTTLLYILGLYEYNSSNMWSDFFIVDRSQGFHSARG